MHSNSAYPSSQYELQQQVCGHDQFSITKEKLAELVEQINHTQSPQQCGHGIKDLFSALKTNIDTGIVGHQRDLHYRRQAFGSNFSSEGRSPRMRKRLKQLVLDAFKDTTIILLLCCATLSFVIGIKTNGLAEAVFDGALVLLAISFVVTFGAIFTIFKARWMIKKSLKHKMAICVVRNGRRVNIPESEAVVGDILWLKKGDHVPADGIFIDGDSFQLNDGLERNYSNYSRDRSLFTGAKVVRGRCRMLVTAVGENRERSMLIRSLGIQQNHDQHDPKLQLLNAIDENNSKLEKIWLSLALILLVLQLVRCFVQRPVQTDKDRNLDPKGVKNTMEDLMNESIKLMKERSKASGLVTMLCILLFASRDGLPLAVIISLLYASNKMKSCEAIIRKLPSSATVGLVTTICTGKTNDLVLQYAKMAELWVGFNLIDNVRGQVATEILDALREGIFVHNSGQGRLEDISLIAWARAVLGLNMGYFHRDCSIVRHEALDVNRNLSCSIIERDEVMYIHWKGAPELILSMCSHYYIADGRKETLDDKKRLAFLQIFHNLGACSQRCFAFAYKLREIKDEEAGVETHKILEHGLTLLGFVGLKNPYTPEVREAIEDCRKSGVRIKLVVDNDINTARIMALNSGLLSPHQDDDEAIVEAANFRTSSQENRMNMIDNIHVMANASPADKLLMVQCLRRKGDIVAAAASCIRDCPSLKEADVGIFMGDECMEVVKEDGDILVLNKNFSQIPGIIKLGRRVCDNLEKFIQLQLTLEISAFSINIISVAASSKEELSSFQILWINLIMEILGALAVAVTTIHTLSSHTECGDTKRVYGSGAVVTRTMYRMIAVQSLFQVTIILIMGMKGKIIFQVNELAMKTMIFICYAFCQVFLLITAIELKRNDFIAGLFTGKNCLFLAVVAMIGILQMPLVEIMGVVAHWSKLDMKQWCICVGVASFSVPLSCAVNWIPISTRK